jgi:glyoxylase-like metal-dependent hydrolase (beta-lactamase superfamily II)
VEPVAPGIHRIPLPLPNDALKAVNVYVVHDDAGVTLIDGGWAVPEALGRLRTGLAELGLGVDDIRSVFATHFHRDHYTLAVQLRRLTGCELALGEGERETLALLSEGRRAADGFAEMLRRAGSPAAEADGEWTRPAPMPYDEPSRWLTDGEALRAAGHDLRALATPGHTRGHFCFADATAGVLFAGDHILPHITPSIGFETAPSHLPLGDYLISLAAIRGRPDTPLLPAHGPVIGSAHVRIDELLAHHDQRLERCGDAVAAGARTAYEVASRLPWTRHERELSDLADFNRVLAIHETLAHLDVLVMRGRLRRLSEAGTDHFEVAAIGGA